MIDMRCVSSEADLLEGLRCLLEENTPFKKIFFKVI